MMRSKMFIVVKKNDVFKAVIHRVCLHFPLTVQPGKQKQMLRDSGQTLCLLPDIPHKVPHRILIHLRVLLDGVRQQTDGRQRSLQLMGGIGHKACDVEIAKLVVEIKSELEKIREQIQNIE